MYKFPTYSAPMLVPNPDKPDELIVAYVSHSRKTNN